MKINFQQLGDLNNWNFNQSEESQLLKCIFNK